MKGKLIKKKLCVLGLVAASVSAGVATPLALSTAQAQEVQAETNSSTKAKKVAVKSVKLNKTKGNLTAGETLKLKAAVSPSNATNKAVTWSSSNTKVATVDKNGNVKGIKAGKAKITVKTKDGGKTATCTITVKAAKQAGKTGWYKENGGMKYYNNGKAYTGWHKMGKAEGEKTEHWSYFGKDGKIYTGWHKMGKAEGEKKAHWSYFGSNGWLRTGWVQFGKGTSEPDGNTPKHWSYFGGNGWLRTGWQWMGKGTNNPDGNSAKHKSYFGDDGWLRTGNQEVKTGKDRWTLTPYSFDGRGWLRDAYYENGKKFTGLYWRGYGEGAYNYCAFKNGKPFTGNAEKEFPKEYNEVIYTNTYNMKDWVSRDSRFAKRKTSKGKLSTDYYGVRGIPASGAGRLCNLFINGHGLYGGEDQLRNFDDKEEIYCPEGTKITLKIGGDTYNVTSKKYTEDPVWFNSKAEINFYHYKWYEAGTPYTLTVNYKGKKLSANYKVQRAYSSMDYPSLHCKSCKYYVNYAIYNIANGDTITMEDSLGGKYTQKVGYNTKIYYGTFYTKYTCGNYRWFKFTVTDKNGKVQYTYTWDIKWG